jgi:hypothetical protein
MLELDWVNVYTSHNKVKSNITLQFILFDLINFIDDSFHPTCQINKKFLNIQQRNNIIPVKDMGGLV